MEMHASIEEERSKKRACMHTAPHSRLAGMSGIVSNIPC